MILGMSVSAFTQFHVLLSLVGIATGLVVLIAILKSRHMSGWMVLFLATTILTSVTGFFFPFDRLLPSHIVGVLSLVLLTIAVLALYRFRLVGPWRWIYVATAIASLYLNVFVAVVQAFAKISFLKPLAPTQSEPPFVVAQAVVLIVFVALGIAALRAFRPEAPGGTLRAA